MGAYSAMAMDEKVVGITRVGVMMASEGRQSVERAFMPRREKEGDQMVLRPPLTSMTHITSSELK
jgi:hypothetical protein